MYVLQLCREKNARKKVLFKKVETEVGFFIPMMMMMMLCIPAWSK